MLIQSEKYRLSKALVSLKKEEEAIFFDYNFPNPLYFSRGKQIVEEFLAKIPPDGISFGEILNPDYQILLELLVQHGILLSGENLSRQTKSCSHECGSSPGEINCYLLLSQYCNLACVYCFNGDESYSRMEKKIMTQEIAFQSVELFLKHLAPQGHLNLIFFGGEPLLNWDLARLLLKHYGNKELPDGKKIHFHLTSNLLVFPDGLVEDIKRYDITILCDVDGPASLHNQTRPCAGGFPSYDRICRNLEVLQKNAIPYSLRATITKSNVHAIEEIVAHHIALGSNVSSLVAINPITSDETVLPVSMLPDPKDFTKGLLQAYQKKIAPANQIFPINQMMETFKIGGTMQFPCGAPQGTTPTVDVNGDIYPCIYFVGISRLKWGTIYDTGNLYQSPLLGSLKSETSLSNQENCPTCPWKYFCGGGCPVKRVLIQANPQASEEIKRYCHEITCLPSKVIFPELIWEFSRSQHKKNIQNAPHEICH
ncbi:MAG: radical SAM protein [Candidatus Brocadiae bacterium]|nr:radical SAM protein [Candidatus Brocadiia bacterium]